MRSKNEGLVFLISSLLFVEIIVFLFCLFIFWLNNGHLDCVFRLLYVYIFIFFSKNSLFVCFIYLYVWCMCQLKKIYKKTNNEQKKEFRNHKLNAIYLVWFCSTYFQKMEWSEYSFWEKLVAYSVEYNWNWLFHFKYFNIIFSSILA